MFEVEYEERCSTMQREGVDVSECGVDVISGVLTVCFPVRVLSADVKTKRMRFGIAVRRLLLVGWRVWRID